MALPFVYFLLPCRFHVVLRAESERVPRFSQLLHASLVLNLFSDGVHFILVGSRLSRPHSPNQIVNMLSGTAYLAGAAATALMYHRQRQQGDSLTLALNVSIFVYLLSLGIAFLLYYILRVAVAGASASDTPVGNWLFGPGEWA